MRIFFLTTNDRVFLPYFFKKVFTEIDCQISGLAVIKDPNFYKFLRNSLSFMGFWMFTKEVLYQLGIRMKDRVKSIFASSKRISIQQVCKQYHVPYYSIDKVNSRNFRMMLKKLDIDILISVACPQILKAQLLNVPRKAAINIHYGLLPFYRGQYPSFWVLANGEEYTGVSVHFMTEKIDAGDILVQSKEKINPDDTFYSLVKRLKTTIGPQALIEAINKIDSGEFEVLRNDPKKGSYFSFPTKDSMLRFKSRGCKWR